jgi:hypothetical protein
MGSPDLDEKNLQRWVDPLDKAGSLGSPRDNSHLSYPKKKGYNGVQAILYTTNLAIWGLFIV